MRGFTLDMMGVGASAGLASAVNGAMLLSQTALGNSQATAFALTVSVTEFTTVAASTGAILQGTTTRVRQGDPVTVVNNGANALSVYPPVGFKIGTAATNAALSVPAGKSAIFLARGDGNYFAVLSA